MADYATQTDAEAKNSIKKCAEDFLTACYQHEIGIFLSDWDDHYKDLKLEDFRQAASREDRMVLPGVVPPLDISLTISQTLAQLWLRFRKDGRVNDNLADTIRACAEEVISQQGIDTEETGTFKDNLVSFLLPRLENGDH